MFSCLSQAYKDEEPKAGSLVVQEKPSRILTGRNMSKGDLILVPYSRHATFAEEDSLEAAALRRDNSKEQVAIDVKMPDHEVEVFIGGTMPTSNCNIFDDKIESKVTIHFWKVGGTSDTSKVNLRDSSKKIGRGIEAPTLVLDKDVNAGDELLRRRKGKDEYAHVADAETEKPKSSVAVAAGKRHRRA